MKREQKSAVIDRVADEIQGADAVFAIDYRGLSVKQAVDLRNALRDADASFRIVKNTLTERAADKADAPALKELLEGPTALTFVHGDVALAAKALARFRREAGILEFKGGQMDGETLTVDQIESIARLPARDVLHGQLVGTIASPLTTLVRGLASMISGLAMQLQQIQEQGLVGGQETGDRSQETGAEAPAAAAESEEPAAPEEAAAEGPDEAPAEEAAAEATAEAPSEAPGDPVAEAEAAEEETSEAPSGGEDQTETEEG